MQPYNIAKPLFHRKNPSHIHFRDRIIHTKNQSCAVVHVIRSHFTARTTYPVINPAIEVNLFIAFDRPITRFQKLIIRNPISPQRIIKRCHFNTTNTNPINTLISISHIMINAHILEIINQIFRSRNHLNRINESKASLINRNKPNHKLNFINGDQEILNSRVSFRNRVIV
ncbi:hypothetical protein HanIR_Chr13g0669831 [Helianthus annuus]|nr:hypothetical protein HanIR_Chr13g0669831 [Helianthus annuus]